MREKRNRLDSASSYGSLTRKGITSSTIWQKHSQEDSQDRRCCSGRSPSRSIASKSSRNYSAMTTATNPYLEQIRQIERGEVHRIPIQHYPLLPIPVIATVHTSRNAPPLLVNPRLSPLRVERTPAAPSSGTRAPSPPSSLSSTSPGCRSTRRSGSSSCLP